MLMEFWWLVPVVFCTAILTAVSGAGGGVILLGLMGTVIPGINVVPVHGAIMSVQNLLRGLLLLRHVDWRFVGVASAGSVAGAALMAPMAAHMPDNVFRLVLGTGLLYLVWMPKPRKPWNFPGKIVVLSVVTCMLSMLIGAAGVLFSVVRRREGHAKEGVLADQSFLMLVQHVLKVLVFGMLGFSFKAYLPLIAAMMASGLLGTVVGVKVLRRMDARWFDAVFKAVVTALALYLLWKAGQTIDFSGGSAAVEV